MNGIGKTIKRRRIEAKTDYKSRFGMLKSGKSRVVIRKTNRYIIVQLVSSVVAQDSVAFGVSSRDLLNEGWPEKKEGSLKSIGAAYLTGLLFAKKAAEKGVREAIVDMGMHRNIKKGRIYAVIKGLTDGGLKVPSNPDSLPDNARIESNANTRELIIKLKDTLKTHGGTRNKK